MPDFAFPPAKTTTLPIQDRDVLFPVRRIYCIGRNYADHAIEMGHDPDKEPPFFFQKNPDNADTSGVFPYPAETSDVHHEVELAVALGSGGTDIPESTALSHVFGYGVALDMTRRDLQGQMKKAGRPWEIGKAFERSAPMGALVTADRVGHPENGAITLHVNGDLRQSGDLNQMIWKVPQMIAWLSRFYTLAAGDVILSGTPAGVAAVKRGDRMEAAIDGIGALSVEVT
ncbi:fumarylacetoacetate hydrolase family protein [Oceaniovalibus sp. ACAM 378]|uniref:fumarylacetoacetate hydrolase family protein n=1 Tax=Oceaniovalibus sp. ACAM 378 TaxID=2599923 RepID=UPI0011DB9602|nr:fumarylacetoacetate hydrolase family protein [Oceaniovalibus sp. ACAM 378]TYB87173.1 fumarylacetoacetate hydrolase family protein [Oceaniovalibus sp. ACAM 378]